MAENSITHERRATFYLSPKNDMLFRGYIARNELGISEAINLMMKEFFNNVSPEERLILLKYAREEMTSKK